MTRFYRLTPADIDEMTHREIHEYLRQMDDWVAANPDQQ